ncbi:MAG: hypothetical protein J5706_05115 [Elusimicrobiales bacterium]|nr:hypothetical protein [Elusimicrobiales bacterium]
MKKIILSFAFLFLAPLPDSANTVISGISWESSPSNSAGVKKSTSAAPAVYSEISEFSIKGFSFDKLRAIVSLNNAAEKKEMGIVIRYSFRLQIKNDESGETFWEVPYQADEVRVPILKAGITRDTKIISLKLREQLKRLHNTGFSPAALKLEVMLSPRKGVSEDVHVSETVLPIKYEPAPQKEPLIKKLPLKRNKNAEK